MSTTTNPGSILWKLRRLMPERPLQQHEALRLAELQANRLLKHFGVDEPGTPTEAVSGLPFVEVALRDDLPISGSAQWLKPRWLILLNAAEPAVRQRFSLMHEFKHVLDHPFIDNCYPATWRWDAERRAELVADYFSASALMPKRLVKRLWGRGVQQPEELAHHFIVSEVAMRYRLQQLGLSERYARCLRRPAVKAEPPVYFRQRTPTLEVLLGAAA